MLELAIGLLRQVPATPSRLLVERPVRLHSRNHHHVHHARELAIAARRYMPKAPTRVATGWGHSL
eukprot:15463441-Alexandrium_andersonii.AAC.1